MKKLIELPDDQLEFPNILDPEVNQAQDKSNVNEQDMVENRKVEKVYKSFTKLSDGSIVEQLYDPHRKSKVFFVRYKDSEISYHDYIELDDETILYPVYNSSIMETKTILFPSKAVDYESEEDLIKQIKFFIHKYLAIPPFYEDLVTFYVKFTWVFDDFTVLPYLKFLGDYGSGKSRALLTTGALCYKPVFCSGAATTSPIFRLIEQFGGTLIIDEGDWDKNNDEHSRLIKILNTGFQKGFPVIISEPSTKGSKLYEPRAYNVYGPKLIGCRRRFKDEALESRCITANMDGALDGRTDIPLVCEEDFWQQAEGLRNKLLMFRLMNLGKVKLDTSLIDPIIEPRLNQVTLPLKSIIGDYEVLESFTENIREFSKSLKQERGESFEGEVLEELLRLWSESQECITMGKLAGRINIRPERVEKPITPRVVGRIVGRTFGLEKERTRIGFIVKRSEKNINKLKQLLRKHGIEESLDDIPSANSPSSHVLTAEDNSLPSWNLENVNFGTKGELE